MSTETAIVQKIAQLRMAKGYSQQTLSDRLKDIGAPMAYSQRSVSLLENGKRFPRINELPWFAEALGCEISELFSWHSNTIRMEDLKKMLLYLESQTDYLTEEDISQLARNILVKIMSGKSVRTAIQECH